MVTTQTDYMRRLMNIQNQGGVSVQMISPKKEPHFIINADSRTIIIPSAFKFLGIKGDHNAETIYFEIDRYFDDHDLSEETCIVQYKMTGDKNLDLGEGFYHVQEYDLSTLPGKIIFGWTIKNSITNSASTVHFSIRFYSVEGSSDVSTVFKYNFNTLETSLPVLDTLNTSNIDTNYSPSEIESLTSRFNDEVKKTKENASLSQYYAVKSEASAKEAQKALDELKGYDGSGISFSGIYPEQFGAIGDGLSDDAAALQSAMNKAAETFTPLELKKTATYLCRSSLELPNNLTIHGNSAVIISELTYEKLGADRPFICITGDSDTVFRHDIKIDNLTVQASDNCQCNVMFRVMRARNITVTNCLFDCEVNEQNRSCMDLYGAYENILVKNTVFRQLTAGEAGGIWVRNWKSSIPCQNVRILNCDFYKAGGDEVLAVWGWNGILKDVLISGCNFYEVDDEKYRRGHYPVWGITLGQRGIRTDVRMENCVVRMNRCETLFRMLGDGTHAVVDNCDIYSDQPDDMEEHDYHKGAFPMLARGNDKSDGSTLFSNNRIHLYGDRGRRICYQISALRNNYFDVTCGYGPSSTKEVISNVFQGSLSGLFWDCNVVRDNLIDLTDSGNAWMSGAGQVIGNDIKLDITADSQGSAVFHNNWNSGSILNNRLTLNYSRECDIRQYEMRGGPQYIQNNLVTISGARYTRLQNSIDGIIYRKNNFFNDIPESLLECTNVAFAENTITEQYKKNTSLDVTILPKNCTDPVIYTWNDPDGVLDIGSHGDYRPIKTGTASVTVNCGMYKDTQTINVALVPVACKSIKLSRTKALCGVGQTTYLKAFVEPYWTTSNITWSSSAKDVATVSQDGEVNLLKIGSANITATCGNQKAVCAITVVAASELPTYTDGELLLDNIVGYVPLPNLAKEHTVYASFDINTNCVNAGESLPLISNMLSGQTGQEAVCIAFGADSNNYKTIRWYTTDVDLDTNGNTMLHQVPYGNDGFEDVASTAFLYLRDGIANSNGGIIWATESSTVKAAPDSGYLSLNVQPNSSDQPINTYGNGTALQTALDFGNVHSTKATGFKLKELIIFANGSYTTLDDIKKYREGAEIDLRFDENGEPVNAGTAGAFIIAGKNNGSETSDTSSILGSAILGKAILNNGGNV